VVRQFAGSKGSDAHRCAYPPVVAGKPWGCKARCAGVSELRIDYGPGYRVYFIERGPMLIILLAGGDKRTQDRDINKALELARKI
jgi:putative addiction module killer protein